MIKQQYIRHILSNNIFNVASVMRRDESSIRFVVVCRFPLQIKLIHLFCVFTTYQLGYKLELLAKTKNSLFKDRHLFRSPSLENRNRCDWIYKNIQISFLVEMIYSVQVQLYGLFLFLGIIFVDIILWLYNLENWMLLGFQLIKKNCIWMFLTSYASLHELSIQFIEIWIIFILFFAAVVLFNFFVRFRHINSYKQ